MNYQQLAQLADQWDQQRGFAITAHGGPGGVTGVLQNAEDSRQRAQFETEQRYQDILEQRLAARDRLMQGINDFGSGQKARVEADYQKMTDDSLATLQSRGLASSNLDTVVRQGVQTQKQLDIGNIEDNLLNSRTNLEAGQEEGIAGFMERRNDTYAGLPDILSAGSAGGAGGSLMSGTGQGGGSLRLPSTSDWLGRHRLAGSGNALTHNPSGRTSPR